MSLLCQLIQIILLQWARPRYPSKKDKAILYQKDIDAICVLLILMKLTYWKNIDRRLIKHLQTSSKKEAGYISKVVIRIDVYYTHNVSRKLKNVMNHAGMLV